MVTVACFATPTPPLHESAGRQRVSRVGRDGRLLCNMPISVYRLVEMPIQSYGQSVSAPRGKAGARLNAHPELRAKRPRSAREAYTEVGILLCGARVGGFALSRARPKGANRERSVISRPHQGRIKSQMLGSGFRVKGLGFRD